MNEGMGFLWQWKTRLIVLIAPARDATWRHRLAWAIRNLADRIDGHKSLSIQFTSTPPLPKATVHAALVRGMAITKGLLTEEAKIAALNDGMERAGWHAGEANSVPR